jgi:hypothetical protein
MPFPLLISGLHARQTECSNVKLPSDLCRLQSQPEATCHHDRSIFGERREHATACVFQYSKRWDIRLFSTPPKTLLILAAVLPPIDGLTGCFFVGRPPHYFLCWIPSLMFETVLFMLMLYRGWRMYKNELRSPLLNLVIRDRYVSH